ncbi:MAG TPA: nucleotidyltransferase domain-containing protein [Anaerolineae bacterium]|nr:nucleotidyltransferase domain-containing protein [Anaerolineae bacterium]
MSVQADLTNLQLNERQALIEFVRGLGARFATHLQTVWLYGSKARGDSTPTSDIDVLVILEGDDWRERKQIRYFAVDLNLKYDLDLSPRVWSAAQWHDVAALGTHFYHNVQREHIDLLQALPLG